MNLRVVVVSAACLTIFVAPASSTSLLAAAAAVKGALIGAGLSGGGSETVIIQSQPGSVAEVMPANQVIVQDLHKPSTIQTAQTITYTSSNPISRFWGAISNAFAAKAKAIGDFFRPNRVVVVVPQTTEKTIPIPWPAQNLTPVITVDVDKPNPIIDIDLGNKPVQLPSVDLGLGNNPWQLPSIDVGLNNNPLQLPSIDVGLNLDPLQLPSIGVGLNLDPLQLPSIGVGLNNNPLQLPSIGVDLNHKPLVLPSIGLSASVGRRVHPVAVVNYGKK